MDRDTQADPMSDHRDVSGIPPDPFEATDIVSTVL